MNDVVAWFVFRAKPRECVESYAGALGPCGGLSACDVLSAERCAKNAQLPGVGHFNARRGLMLPFPYGRVAAFLIRS